jgi:hypothetical protein
MVLCSQLQNYISLCPIMILSASSRIRKFFRGSYACGVSKVAVNSLFRNTSIGVNEQKR